MKVSPSWRKALLTVHVVTAVGWLGVSAVLLTLGIAGLTGSDAAVVYPAIGLIGVNLLAPLAVVTWLLSIVISLLTPWGLLKYWWVLVKLIITTVLTALVVFVLHPSLRLVSDPGAVLTLDVQRELVIAPAVSTVAMIAATVLSSYKPWRRTGLKV